MDDAENEGVQSGELLAWCVVANIPGGSKHFARNARVWVLPPKFFASDNVYCVGRGSRPPHRQIRVFLDRRRLANARVMGIYSPAQFAALRRPPKNQAETPRLWDGKADAQEFADLLNNLWTFGPR